MSQPVELMTGLVLLLVFAICIKASTEVTEPKRRAALSYTGWTAGIGVLWLVCVHGYLATHQPLLFFPALLGTTVGVYAGIRELVRHRAKQVGK